MKILGMVLAGGASRRMGGETKALKDFGGEPLFQRVVGRLGPQVAHLVVNSNDPPEALKSFGMPVISDVVPGRIGPLSGILSGLYYCEYHGCQACMVVPCDAPFLAEDIVSRLASAMAGQKPAYARSEGRDQPVFSLWPVAAMEALENLVVEENVRSVIKALETLEAIAVEFPESGMGSFLNLNTPEEWLAAEALLKTGA